MRVQPSKPVDVDLPRASDAASTVSGERPAQRDATFEAANERAAAPSSERRALIEDVLRGFAMEPTLVGASLIALARVRAAETFHSATLWLLDPAREVLRCVAVSHDSSVAEGENARASMLLSPRRGDGPVGLAWADDTTVVHGERATRPSGPGSPGPRTTVCVPLRAHGRVRGVLELVRDDAEPIGPETLAALEAVAGELGPVVEARRTDLDEAAPRREDAPGPLPPPRIAFFDTVGRITFESGPPLAPVLPERARARHVAERWGGAEHPVVRGFRRAVDGDAFSELVQVAGVGTRVLAFSPVRDHGAAIVGVIGLSIDDGRLTSARDRMAELGAGAARELHQALTQSRLACSRGIDAETVARTLAPALERIQRVADALGAVSREHRDTGPEDLEAALDGVLSLLGHRLDGVARVVRDYGSVPPVAASPGALHRVLADSLLALIDGVVPAPGPPAELHVGTARTGEGRVVATLEHRRSVPPPPGAASVDGPALGAVVDSARDLVRGIGGELVAESTNDHAAIHVGLPATRETPSRGAARRGARRRPAGPTASLRILVVDDDAPIAEMVARELDDHDVTIARGGRHALSILFRPHEFDVVLCDLMMPDLSGMDVYELVRLHDPACAKRFVFMTGAAFTNRASSFLEEVRCPRILKPFSGDSLRAIVRSVLPRTARD